MSVARERLEWVEAQAIRALSMEGVAAARLAQETMEAMTEEVQAQERAEAEVVGEKKAGKMAEGELKKVLVPWRRRRRR